MEVVAEGIEDKPTLELLRDLGCDYGQGYFISKPVSIHEFAELSAGSSARRGGMCVGARCSNDCR
jgi:EAL domain-containing protein (putative c-di-GMP-specific phosphodiesterase class I)